MSLHNLPHSDPVHEAQQQLRRNAIAIDRHNHIAHKQTPPPVHHGHTGNTAVATPDLPQDE